MAASVGCSPQARPRHSRHSSSCPPEVQAPGFTSLYASRSPQKPGEGGGGGGTADGVPVSSERRQMVCLCRASDHLIAMPPGPARQGVSPSSQLRLPPQRPAASSDACSSMAPDLTTYPHATPSACLTFRAHGEQVLLVQRLEVHGHVQHPLLEQVCTLRGLRRSGMGGGGQRATSTWAAVGRLGRFGMPG